jgi:hypothetical protein
LRAFIHHLKTNGHYLALACSVLSFTLVNARLSNSHNEFMKSTKTHAVFLEPTDLEALFLEGSFCLFKENDVSLVFSKDQYFLYHGDNETPHFSGTYHFSQEGLYLSHNDELIEAHISDIDSNMRVMGITLGNELHKTWCSEAKSI